MLKAKLNVSCNSEEIAKQMMTCGITGTHCSHLNLNCSNTATLSANCDTGQLIQAAADTLVKMEDPKALRKALNLALDAPESDVRANISTQINSSCDSVQAASQTVDGTFLCDYSDGVVLDVFNQMNVQSACAAGKVLGMATQAQANSGSAGRIIIIVVACILLLLYAIILIVIIIKLRASGLRLPPINSRY